MKTLGAWMLGAGAAFSAPGIDDTGVWTHGGFGGYSPTLSGVTISPDSAMCLPTIRRCVMLNANSLAMVPLKHYTRRGDDQIETHDDAVTPILRRPNGWQTEFEYRRDKWVSIMLRGNFYAQKLYDSRGRIGELIPINPDNVWVSWTMRGLSRRRHFEVQQADPGGARSLTQDQMHHVYLESLDGGLTGASPIALHANSIGVLRALETDRSAFFGNGSRLGLVFKWIGGGKPSDEKVEEFNKKVNAEHAGPYRAYKHMLVTPTVELMNQPTTISARDAQVIESQRWQVGDVSRAYGTPLALLNENTKDTSWGSGIEQLFIAFRTYTLAPLSKMDEDAIDRDLVIGVPNNFVEYNLDGLLMADSETRWKNHEVAVRIGATNPYNVSRKENVPTRTDPDAKRYRRDQNIVFEDQPTDAMVAAERAAVTAPPNGKNGELEAHA